jgi:hypothetical protein
MPKLIHAELVLYYGSDLSLECVLCLDRLSTSKCVFWDYVRCLLSICMVLLVFDIYIFICYFMYPST